MIIPALWTSVNEKQDSLKTQVNIFKHSTWNIVLMSFRENVMDLHDGTASGHKLNCNVKMATHWCSSFISTGVCDPNQKRSGPLRWDNDFLGVRNMTWLTKHLGILFKLTSFSPYISCRVWSSTLSWMWRKTECLTSAVIRSHDFQYITNTSDGLFLRLAEPKLCLNVSLFPLVGT